MDDYDKNDLRNSIEQCCENIKEIIRQEYLITDVAYREWIEPLKYGGTTGNMVNIIIPHQSAHAGKYISTKYRLLFQKVFSDMNDRCCEVKFITEAEPNDA